MKVNSISYEDKDSNWCLDKVEFSSLTLLVGASGVGKTQILQTLLRLRAITNGESISGIKWSIDFTTISGLNYIWSGEFESKGKNIYTFKDSENDDKEDSPKLIAENLKLNGEEIIERNNEQIIFDGQKTVKLSQDKSVIDLLKEEDLIAPAHVGFGRIIFSDQVESKKRPHRFNPDFLTKERILKKYSTIESIRESDENIITKLYLASNNALEVMDAIKDKFIDIFPFVTDIRIAPLDYDSNDDTPSVFKEIPFIQIKEKDVTDWVVQSQISSGMFRTLMHLSELYLCAEGTIILIDEFENSLGVNCIDELTVDLQTSSSRNLQFIITSHHPYIINQISSKNWKLVSRKGSSVKTKDAVEIFDITKSKQEAFIQLTQLEEFTTGITE